MSKVKIKYDSSFIDELYKYDGNDFLDYVNSKYFGYSQKDCLNSLYYMFVKNEISKEMLYLAYQKIGYADFKRKLNVMQTKAVQSFFNNESYLNIDSYLKENNLGPVGSLYRSFLETDYNLYCKYLLEKYRRELEIVKSIYELNEMISNNEDVDAYTCYLRLGCTAESLRSFIGNYDTKEFESFKGLYLNSALTSNSYVSYDELKFMVKQKNIGINLDLVDFVIEFMSNNKIPVNEKIFNALYKRARSTKEPFDKVLVYSN